MHANEGQLSAYLDEELDPASLRTINAHLETCSTCQEKLEAIQARRHQMQTHLQVLGPNVEPSARAAAVARAKLQTRIQNQEEGKMINKIFARRYRKAWATAGVVAILALALAFPPVRAIANSFLGLFRVQQFSVVQINPGDLPEQLGSSSQLESMLSTNVNVEELGEPQEVASVEEAQALSGINVRLPTYLEDAPDLRVTPGAHVSFDIDMAHVNAVLAEIGRGDIQLPAALDGAQVSIDISNGVTAQYGDCSFDVENVDRSGEDPDNPRVPRLPECTTLLQSTSPVVEAPPGLDIARIGEAFLQVLGMSPDEAAQFSKNIDWTTTFVIPIPQYGTSYQDVVVDGVDGTFIRQDLQRSPDQYMLLWVKDDIVYALTGPGSMRTALKIAESLE